MKMKDTSLLTQQAVKETPIIRHYLCGIVHTYTRKQTVWSNLESETDVLVQAVLYCYSLLHH